MGMLRLGELPSMLVIFTLVSWQKACKAALVSLTGLRMVSFDKGFKQFSGLTLLALLTPWNRQKNAFRTSFFVLIESVAI